MCVCVCFCVHALQRCIQRDLLSTCLQLLTLNEHLCEYMCVCVVPSASFLILPDSLKGAFTFSQNSFTSCGEHRSKKLKACGYLRPYCGYLRTQAKTIPLEIYSLPMHTWSVIKKKLALYLRPFLSAV